MYADIIIDISSEKLDRTFQYHVPECLEKEICAGIQVDIPFGKSDRAITGYVVELTEECKYDPDKIKDILGVHPGSITVESRLVTLAFWIKRYFGGTVNAALKTVMPVKKKVNSRKKDPLALMGEPKPPVSLNKSQQSVADRVCNEYEIGKKGVYLLHGVTGSGKTEVYMEIISRIVAHGQQAIVLIPEISLTYQTVQRFMGRFPERISILHSKMSKGERYDQMEKARNGEIDIMIGPRSALFAPFPDLGLIIVDEEHESSYKSETVPKYHAREVAIQRAKDYGASVVLGSATPSLDSYYRAQKGEFTLLELPDRVQERSLPDCEIVNLGAELRAGNRSILSNRLQELMEDRLSKGEQTMLFLNRRGVSGFISCRSCGEVIKCPHCDVSMTEHRGGRLVCHYCGHTAPKPKQCPKCHSKYVYGFKAGTEKIEEVLSQRFPDARILRMDADTTTKKGDYERILKTFATGKADILLGTQMIVKGHDFPKVTLVGILAADLSLGVNDYRAAERTFQLLTQAAGRAGRGEMPGKVVIQTYQPDHYAVTLSGTGDYKEFYKKEIAYRALLGYPPVGHIMCILLTSEKKDVLDNAATMAANFANMYAGKSTIVLGSSDAGIGKIADVYRVNIYLKSIKYENLVAIKDKLEEYMLAEPAFKYVQSQFDFDA